MIWRTSWPVDPLEASTRLDQRFPKAEAGYVLIRAGYTVEGLNYLAELDAALPESRPAYIPAGISVDLAHARWASADAITAIDLCAAALGRMHCGYPKRGQELDFRQAEKKPELLARPTAKSWLAAVQADPEYRQALWLRHALIHRTVRGPIEVSLGLPGTTGANVRRPRIQVPSDFGGPVGVDELVPRSRDLALRHVSAFAGDVGAL